MKEARENRVLKDHIAVEGAFALTKNSYGLGLLVTKFDEMTGSSIAYLRTANYLAEIFTKQDDCGVSHLLSKHKIMIVRGSSCAEKA